jgi:hypothetical protein
MHDIDSILFDRRAQPHMCSTGSAVWIIGSSQTTPDITRPDTLSDQYRTAIRLLTLGCLPEGRASRLTADGDKISAVSSTWEEAIPSQMNSQEPGQLGAELLDQRAKPGRGRKDQRPNLKVGRLAVAGAEKERKYGLAIAVCSSIGSGATLLGSQR